MMVGGPAMTRAALTYITGPVRGVAFHPTRDLLVTGGDDYKVRVWGTHTPKSYGEKLIRVRKCLQTRKYRIASVSSLFMAIWTMFARASFTTRCLGLCAIFKIQQYYYTTVTDCLCLSSQINSSRPRTIRLFAFGLSHQDNV
jgi:WD40 repeat protein